MCGKDCDLCGRHNALFRVTSEVDKTYDKALCLECWQGMSEKEKEEKKLDKHVVMW